MKTEQITITELKKLFSGRKIYVRNGDARYLITKTSFNLTHKQIETKKLFTVEYNERYICLEHTLQLK